MQRRRHRRFACPRWGRRFFRWRRIFGGGAQLLLSSVKWDDFVDLDIIDYARIALNATGNNLPLERWSSLFDEELRVVAIVV